MPSSHSAKSANPIVHPDILAHQTLGDPNNSADHVFIYDASALDIGKVPLSDLISTTVVNPIDIGAWKSEHWVAESGWLYPVNLYYDGTGAPMLVEYTAPSSPGTMDRIGAFIRGQGDNEQRLRSTEMVALVYCGNGPPSYHRSEFPIEGRTTFIIWAWLNGDVEWVPETYLIYNGGAFISGSSPTTENVSASSSGTVVNISNMITGGLGFVNAILEDYPEHLWEDGFPSTVSPCSPGLYMIYGCLTIDALSLISDCSVKVAICKNGNNISTDSIATRIYHSANIGAGASPIGATIIRRTHVYVTAFDGFYPPPNSDHSDTDAYYCLVVAIYDPNNDEWTTAIIDRAAPIKHFRSRIMIRRVSD